MGTLLAHVDAPLLRKDVSPQQLNLHFFFFFSDSARLASVLRELRHLYRIHLPAAGLVVRGLDGPGPEEDSEHERRTLPLLHHPQGLDSLQAEPEGGRQEAHGQVRVHAGDQDRAGKSILRSAPKKQFRIRKSAGRRFYPAFIDRPDF